MTQEPPLRGLRVLDLSRLLPGPYLTLVLADMGADVVKVEAPGAGDWVRWLSPQHGGMAAQFIALNRGKRSIALDLKRPGGAETLLRLARRADVVVESFRPGVMDRLGVGWEALHAENPGLVYCAISGFGQTGPYRDRAGHDLNYLGLSGALAASGVQDGPPAMPGFQLADLAGGALFGLVGVLAAIVARQQTGQGRFVDVSMTEGALAINALTLSQVLGGGGPLARGTDQLAGGAACYGVYLTSDGRYLTLAALEPKFWQAFCEAVGHPEWRTRHMGDPGMRADLEALFGTATRDEWMARLGTAEVCVEPVLELHELDGHPLHAARGVFFDLDQPGAQGPLRQFRTPLVPPEDTGAIGPAPRLGEHTRQVLSEAGLDDEAIEALVRGRVVTAG